MDNIEEFLRKQRGTNIKLEIGVQNISDFNRRDEFLNELNNIKAEFSRVNRSGKSFFGFQEMSEKLKKAKGSKKLIDVSTIEIYKNWYIDTESNTFIAITSEGEKIVKFEDVAIVD